MDGSLKNCPFLFYELESQAEGVSPVFVVL